MNANITQAIDDRETASPGKIRISGMVLGAALGNVFGFSAAYVSTLSLFLKPIVSAFGWSRGQASTVVMLAQLGLALGAPLLGGLINRHGAHKVIPFSILLFAAGLFMLAQSPASLVIFGACSFLLGFAAAGTTPAGYLTALPGVFDNRLGLAMGLAMLGLGLGNTVMPVVIQNWISVSGWRGAYENLALTVLIGGAIAVAFLYGPILAGSEQSSRAVGSGDPTQAGVDLASAMRTVRFWTIAVILFAVSGAVLGAIVHMVSALTDRGIPAGQASLIAATIGIGITVGRFGVGVLLDLLDARYVAAAAFAVGSLGLGLIAANFSVSITVASISAFLFAFAIGAEGDFIPYFVRRYFGLRQFSLIYGVQFAFFAVGGVLGPILFGLGYDHFGNYTVMYGAASAVCAVCAIVVTTLGRYRYGVNASSH
jgi:MFS transporter, OFA family, oxalate/formate antiporter